MEPVNAVSEKAALNPNPQSLRYYANSKTLQKLLSHLSLAYVQSKSPVVPTYFNYFISRFSRLADLWICKTIMVVLVICYVTVPKPCQTLQVWRRSALISNPA